MSAEILPGGRVRLRIASAHPLAAVECAVLGLHLLWLAQEWRENKTPELTPLSWEKRLGLAGMGAPAAFVSGDVRPPEGQQIAGVAAE